MGGNRHGAGELVKDDGEVRAELQVYWSGHAGLTGQDRELQGRQAGQLHHHQGEDCIKTHTLYETFPKQIVKINQKRQNNQ